MNGLSPHAFDAIAQFFHSVSGIRLVESKQALVQSRLQKLAHECGEQDLNVFIERVVRRAVPEPVIVQVIDRLTTNETSFFREPPHFEDLARRATQPGELLVWSAAASTGEEAYSIAMLLSDKRPQAPWRIIGTDLSTQVLETARTGLYSLQRTEKLPTGYQRRFCLKGSGPYEGMALIKPELRQRVEFLQANLMQELPRQLPQFQVIFLRNVLIYFDAPAKAAIVRRVLSRLKPDGVLYTGHAESLSSLDLPIRPVTTAIYTHA